VPPRLKLLGLCRRLCVSASPTRNAWNHRCHSAKVKREREQFSQNSGAAEALGKANAEIDTLKADQSAKAGRISELEGLVAERTSAAEKLQDELSKAGLVQQKFDFSNASSREAAPPATITPTAAKTESAPFVDPLLSFVKKSGSGGGRIGLSASNHRTHTRTHAHARQPPTRLARPCPGSHARWFVCSQTSLVPVAPAIRASRPRFAPRWRKLSPWLTTRTSASGQRPLGFGKEWVVANYTNEQ